jgi:hypothetical protein
MPVFSPDLHTTRSYRRLAGGGSARFSHRLSTAAADPGMSAWVSGLRSRVPGPLRPETWDLEPGTG